MTEGKLLLTSSGITNDSIQTALVELLRKPISESNALFVPTAVYAYPVGITHAWQMMKAPDSSTMMNSRKPCPRALAVPGL